MKIGACSLCPALASSQACQAADLSSRGTLCCEHPFLTHVMPSFPPALWTHPLDLPSVTLSRARFSFWMILHLAFLLCLEMPSSAPPLPPESSPVQSSLSPLLESPEIFWFSVALLWGQPPPSFSSSPHPFPSVWHSQGPLSPPPQPHHRLPHHCPALSLPALPPPSVCAAGWRRYLGTPCGYCSCQSSASLVQDPEGNKVLRRSSGVRWANTLVRHANHSLQCCAPSPFLLPSLPPFFLPSLPSSFPPSLPPSLPSSLLKTTVVLHGKTPPPDAIYYSTN